MMMEYEYIFSNTLKNKIIEKIKGGVKTWITRDELHVSILLDQYNIQFEHVIPNISDRILNGYTTDYALYEVTKVYKAYLSEKLKEIFFK